LPNPNWTKIGAVVNEFCIIGSGPSAVSAAVALTRRNLKVVMLDAGISLDSARQAVVAEMGEQSPDVWRTEQLASVKNGVNASSNGIPLKRLYGSEFPYAPVGWEPFEIEAENVDLKPSFARGGLSTIWGAGVLPFHPDDIRDWPFGADDLAEHYRAVFSFMPLSGTADELEKLFPSFAPTWQELKPSTQAQAFLNDAFRARSRLRRRGIFVGRSRLAVDANAARFGRRNCQYCGLCLYGCPYELIYRSEYTLRDLRKLPNFRYESDFVVQELREDAGQVRILGRHRINGDRRELVAARVLLGAGVIPSTAILLRSMREYDIPMKILDSAYFLMPLLRWSQQHEVSSEQLHTLAQAFIIMRHPSMDEPLVHLSVYTYNDLTVPALRAAVGPLGNFGSRLWKALGSRLLVCGGYLHSSLSPGISMVLHKTSKGERILLKAETRAETSALIRRVGRRLLRDCPSLRAIPLLPAVRQTPPGRGFHSGGSFPMQRERTPHTSDVEGRPFGFERVHLIDASCVPSIPATPITLPVMANAHRIATLAADRGV
jgi:choline dehydrogenase-like flavoprotein